jgi:hypothetical protein
VVKLPPPCTLSVLLAALALAGCASDGVATLSGALDKPTVAVNRSALAGDVTGGFELFLELGEFAAGPTEVSLGAFVIERDGNELLPALSLSGATFPVRIAPKEKRRLPLTFDMTAELSVADGICLGPVSFRGSVTDSLGKNRPTTLTSIDATPSCTDP